MTDILGRLRERAVVALEENTRTSHGDAVHFNEAASEIEHLRFELKAARNEIKIADAEIQRLHEKGIS